MRQPKQKPDDPDIVDAYAEGLVGTTRRAADIVEPPAQAQAEARQTMIEASTTTSLARGAEPALYGSQAFFRRAAEELAASTRTTRELAGACFVKEKNGRLVLVGLRRDRSGLPGRVAIDPTWGTVLWHTHPGLRASLAAFSLEDLDVTRQTGLPLLVIGFAGLSLDVLSSFTMPLGWRAALTSLSVKGLLSLEKSGRLSTGLLELGVGVRVCWPSGRIAQVHRLGASPLQLAVDDMSFAVDRGVGAMERTGQRAFRGVVNALVGRKP